MKERKCQLSLYFLELFHNRVCSCSRPLCNYCFSNFYDLSPFVLASDSALAWTISVSSRTRRKEVMFFFSHLKVDVCNPRLIFVHVNLVSWHNSHHSPYAHFSKVLSINWQVMGSTPVVQLREMLAFGRRKVSVLSLGQFFPIAEFFRFPPTSIRYFAPFFRFPPTSIRYFAPFFRFLRFPPTSIRYFATFSRSLAFGFISGTLSLKDFRRLEAPVTS